jgi:hypothetical protein
MFVMIRMFNEMLLTLGFVRLSFNISDTTCLKKSSVPPNCGDLKNLVINPFMNGNNPRVSNISLNILIITNIMFYKKYSRMKICAYVCCFYKTNILKKVSVMLRKTKIRFCVTKIKILCIKFKL